MAWWPASPGHPAAARTEEFTFDAGALAAGDDTALGPVCAALRRAAPAARTLHVALAAPWAASRELALPPMREEEARLVLTRDATRHFSAARAEPVIAVRSLSRGLWLASDADGVVLDAIARAAHRAGLPFVRFVPAVAAWAHAAGDSSSQTFVVEGEATVIGAQRAAVTRCRRCRPVDLQPGTSGTVDALSIAARHAPQATDAELATVRVRAARRTLASQVTRQLLGAGIMLLVTAAALTWWGSAHRLARLEARRASLHPVIATPLALRDSLLRTDDALAVLAKARADGPVWSHRLTALASALPDDAYFTTWRGGGDSVVVEGRADDAAQVVERLRTARGVEGVRAAAPTTASDGSAAFSVIVRFGAGRQP